MDLDREQKIEELCNRVMDLPEEEVEPWLSSVCPDDPELVEEVMNIIMWMDRTDQLGLLDQTTRTGQGTPGQEKDDLWDFRDPEVIGPYSIIRKLGEGGMGRVYLAEQSEPIQRKVALKLLHSSVSATLNAAHIARESRAMALLSHPNVAQVFEVGDTAKGIYYLAMEYVEGEPLNEYCKKHNPSLSQRLDLLISVCRGVEHAHSRGIIHRDLKPSNILITQIDKRPVPKIIDFGIAKNMETVTATLNQGMVGTPVYMCPEMVDGEMTDLELDHRVDVYALGIILFEILTHTKPIDAREVDLVSILHRIIHEDIPKPSTKLQQLEPARLKAIAESLGYRPRTYIKHLARELDWITAKATSRKRELRYDSAEQLALDLDAVLHHRNVLATPKTPAYLIGNWIRRSYGGIAAASIIFILMAIGLGARSIEARRAQMEAEKAHAALAEARKVSEFLIGVINQMDPRQTLGEALDVGNLLRESMTKAESELADQPLVLARLLHNVARLEYNLGNEQLAMSYLVRARELIDERGDRLELADILLLTAKYQIDGGHFNQARANLIESLALTRAFLGTAHPKALSIQSTLAELELLEGNHDASLTLYKALLEQMRHELGPDDLEVGKRSVYLGREYMFLGRYALAERYIREGIPILEAALPKNHPNILMGWTQLARVLHKRGNHAEAIKIMERILPLRLEVHGLHNAIAANAMYFLGHFYLDEGRIEDAEALIERALTIWQDIKGPDHRNTAWGYNDMGRIYTFQKRYDEAENALREALMINKNLFGEENYFLCETYTNLGDLHRAQQRFDDAESAYRRALQILEKTMGPKHPDRVQDLAKLGELCAEQERDEEARNYLTLAKRLSRKTLDPSHPTVTQIDALLARLALASAD